MRLPSLRLEKPDIADADAQVVEFAKASRADGTEQRVLYCSVPLDLFFFSEMLTWSHRLGAARSRRHSSVRGMPDELAAYTRS